MSTKSPQIVTHTSTTHRHIHHTSKPASPTAKHFDSDASAMTKKLSRKEYSSTLIILLLVVTDGLLSRKKWRRFSKSTGRMPLKRKKRGKKVHSTGRKLSSRPTSSWSHYKQALANTSKQKEIEESLQEQANCFLQKTSQPERYGCQGNIYLRGEPLEQHHRLQPMHVR